MLSKKTLSADKIHSSLAQAMGLIILYFVKTHYWSYLRHIKIKKKNFNLFKLVNF